MITTVPSVEVLDVPVCKARAVQQLHPQHFIAYNQLIRPWKSRLALFYIRHQGIVLDLRLVVLTALAIVSRPKALSLVAGMLEQMGADPPW